MVVKAPAPPAVTAVNWTGFYVGGFLGAGAGGAHLQFLGDGRSNPRIAGVIGGGQVGYNWQINQYVVGRRTQQRSGQRAQLLQPGRRAQQRLPRNVRFGRVLVGYGTELALTPNWSAKAEFDYIDFGNQNVVASDGGLLTVGVHVAEAKVGVNYRFSGAGPVVAKY